MYPVVGYGLCASWTSYHMGFVPLGFHAIWVWSGPLVISVGMQKDARTCLSALTWTKGIMNTSFVHMFPLWGLFMAMVLGMYFYAIRVCSVLTPEGSPLDRILADLSTYSYNPMTKNKLIFYCNTVWNMYTLDYGKNGP